MKAKPFFQPSALSCFIAVDGILRSFIVTLINMCSLQSENYLHGTSWSLNSKLQGQIVIYALLTNLLLNPYCGNLVTPSCVCSSSFLTKTCCVLEVIFDFSTFLLPSFVVHIRVYRLAVFIPDVAGSCLPCLVACYHVDQWDSVVVGRTVFTCSSSWMRKTGTHMWSRCSTVASVVFPVWAEMTFVADTSVGKFKPVINLFSSSNLSSLCSAAFFKCQDVSTHTANSLSDPTCKYVLLKNWV